MENTFIFGLNAAQNMYYSKEASNKSCWEFFFSFSVSVQFNISTISSFEHPTSTPRGDRHMPLQTFLSEIRCRKTFSWALFWDNAYFQQHLAQKWMYFPFLYNFIFKPYHLSSPLAPLQGEIDICPRTLPRPKFDAETLLFASFFVTIRIFSSVQPKSEGW